MLGSRAEGPCPSVVGLGSIGEGVAGWAENGRKNGEIELARDGGWYKSERDEHLAITIFGPTLMLFT